MTQPSRSRARGTGARRRPKYRFEGSYALEDRALLTPYLTVNQTTATFTAAATPTNPFLGTVTVTQGAAVATSAAPFVSVSQFAPSSAFGGDIVRIEAGPGGDFGRSIYAISRGDNDASTTPATLGGNPGIIYRLDPATGIAQQFFDLNTVISQIEPGGTAAASGGAATGLVNWYDLSFDPEGYFDGRPSLFVSSVDVSNPNKNVVYRVAPDGSFLGAFIRFDEGIDTLNFTRRPTALLTPPPEQQDFLRGLFVGDGGSAGGFTALFFDANAFRPGTDLTTAALPFGVTPTGLTFGPQVGLTSANNNYGSPVYSAFTDFGDPGIPGLIPPAPGLSGVQGLGGELLINGGAPIIGGFSDPNFTTVDASAAITTPFRRFQDIAFDQYGFFSYGSTVAGNGATPIPPTFVGSVFVTDLATGLSVNVAPVAPFPVTPTINVPIQGPGAVAVEQGPDGVVRPVFTNGSTTGGNIGGRVVRISPTGVVTNFAEGFNTSGRQDAGSFVESSLSITFSADGTTLYVADNDGIWQFKTVTSLANSTSGSVIGLNDIRTFGVPYDGRDSSVAIIDSGVDATNESFRGRVAPGRNEFTNGFGNDDTAAIPNGHGTLVAGAVAQFVPQATLQPINVFTPLVRGVVVGGGTTGASNGDSTPQLVYEGLQFTADNPFVADPVRPNKLDRLTTSSLGFGTIQSFDGEGTAFQRYKQIVLAFKNQLQRFRKLGIAPIGAAGQFGQPNNDGVFPNPNGTGDIRGMALPGTLNEVVSVTGTYPFPYTATATTAPNDPVQGIIPRPAGPVLIFNGGATPLADPGDDPTLSPAALSASDATLFVDKLLSSANRSVVTDFAAPAIDVPTFRRTAAATGPDNLTFQRGGTSLSAALVTGSFAVTASALDYFTDLARDGFTVDAYLTQPVGARQLNYGTGRLRDLSAYANPDGINSILQWTAVPAVDDANFFADAIALADANAERLNPPFLFGSGQPRSYSRVDIGNAVAAIEGSVALSYLFGAGTFDVIDSNDNGLITAQEIQTFVDTSGTIGLAEAGSMARFLGGTARIPGQRPIIDPADNLLTVQFAGGAITGVTTAGEQPDQPDVLQRRFNFFDFAADGRLDGVVSVQQYQVLTHFLLPPPDSFVVTDRQRSSATNYLLAPTTRRASTDLQHILPRYQFVPAATVRRFRNLSPNQFGFGRGRNPFASAPFFTLFQTRRAAVKAAASGTGAGSGTGTGTATTGSGTGTAATGNRTSTVQVTPQVTPTTGVGTTGTGQATTTTTASQQQQQVLDALRNLANLPAGATSGTGAQAQQVATTTTTPAATTGKSVTPAGSVAPTTGPGSAAEAAATTPTATAETAAPIAATTTAASTPRPAAQALRRVATPAGLVTATNRAAAIAADPDRASRRARALRAQSQEDENRGPFGLTGWIKDLFN